MPDNKPCKKCGSTFFWCGCCPACGEVHHLRDCPNPVIGLVNLKPVIDGLEGMKMEKRGVVLDDDKTKTASIEKRCPSCGAELSDPTHCPNCGTKPFEKRRDDAGKEEGSQ